MDHIPVECGDHQLARVLAVAAVRDQLCDHRVVVHRNLAALGATVVYPHKPALAALALGAHRQVCSLVAGGLVGRAVGGERADRRQEAAQRVLGVHARLDRPADPTYVRLRDGELLAGGDADHLLDEVDAGHALCDRVFDLQPRVHLEEVVLVARVDEELDRPCRAVADRLRELHRLLPHPTPRRLRKVRCGRLLDHLLVAPLHGALALGQVDDVAVRVRDELDLDVARLLDVALDEDAVIAEGCRSLALRQTKRLPRLRLVPGNAHALAAAAGRRLDHHREANLARDTGRLVGVRDHALKARDRGDASLCGEALGLDLVAHRVDRKGGRADEGHARRLHRLGEGCVLREEAVAGVHRLGAGRRDGVEDAVDPQVRVGRRRAAHTHRLTRQRDVRRPRVRLRVHRDRLDAHAVRGAHHAAGDLAAIGHEQLLEERARRRHPSQRLAGQHAACSTGRRGT
mmetsp:Transcript_26613/g.77749  ORF Transcript_26613/g.77749 Transcript_26613/m.77749 type:complete len:459 (+) Transcript_26613:417-1793(+)